MTWYSLPAMLPASSRTHIHAAIIAPLFKYSGWLLAAQWVV
jgi:hypothetical protein